MLPIKTDDTGENRLRFIFNDTVVSLNLATEVTLEEIAQRLGTLSTRRYGTPVSIDITLGSREGERIRSALQ